MPLEFPRADRGRNVLPQSRPSRYAQPNRSRRRPSGCDLLPRVIGITCPPVSWRMLTMTSTLPTTASTATRESRPMDDRGAPYGGPVASRRKPGQTPGSREIAASGHKPIAADDASLESISRRTTSAPRCRRSAKRSGWSAMAIWARCPRPKASACPPRSTNATAPSSSSTRWSSRVGSIPGSPM